MCSATKTQMLLNLLRDLEPDEIAILHGYLDYPTHIPSDVDIIGRKNVLDRLKYLASTGRYKAVQVIQHEATCYYWVFSARGENRKPAFLHLDYAADYRRDGRVFYRAEDLLVHRRMYKEIFPVLPPALEFGYYVVKKVGKGRLEARHEKRLTELFRHDPEGCSKELARFFPENEFQILIQAAESGDWSQVRARIRTLRMAMLRKVAAERPWDVVSYYVGDLNRRVRRVLQPTGLVVAFMGMDGSGKSTVIKEVGRDLLPAFRRKKVIHLRPSLREKSGVGPVIDPHGKPPRNFLLSVAKLFYWWIGYALGWILDVFPRKVRSTFVLFDRYYHDLLADPKRYRYGGPMWLARLVGRFIPKPDLFILLDLPAEVAHTRKPEVPLEEARKLRERYLKLARNLPNAYVVDASRSLEEVVAEVEEIILDYTSEVTVRRLRTWIR